jgi:hypothetical protein
MKEQDWRFADVVFCKAEPMVEEYLSLRHFLQVTAIMG